MTRLRPGDRVRHVYDPVEGIVDTVEPSDRPGGLAVVTVQVDAGGVERQAEGFWELLPNGGRLSA